MKNAAWIIMLLAVAAMGIGRSRAADTEGLSGTAQTVVVGYQLDRVREFPKVRSSISNSGADSVNIATVTSTTTNRLTTPNGARQNISVDCSFTVAGATATVCLLSFDLNADGTLDTTHMSVSDDRVATAGSSTNGGAYLAPELVFDSKAKRCHYLQIKGVTGTNALVSTSMGSR